MDAKKPPYEKTAAEVAAELREPFPPNAVGWKPQMVKNNRALAAAYIDARDVQNRLDEAAGAACWQDDYDILPNGSVVCRLRVRFGPEWVTKTDVGSPSEQPDGGDRLKAAFSDALKRAAVKFGVGRYLYELPSTWVEYDPAKRQIVTPPALPEWAIPTGYRPAGPSLADKANRLAVQYCKESGADVGTYTAGILKAMNCNPTAAIATLQTRFVQGMLRKVNKDIAELAARQTGKTTAA